MKKQTEILTKTVAQPPARRKNWILLTLFVTLIYRNPFNRISPSGFSPNGFNTVKKVITEVERLIGLATHYSSIFQCIAIAGLIIFIGVAILHTCFNK